MPIDQEEGQMEEVEKLPNGEEQPEDMPASEEPTEEPQEDTQEDELPEDVKERTREQFEKLKAHNKQLAEEIKQMKGSSQPIPSVLDYLNPAQVPQTFVPQQQYQSTPQQGNQPEPQLVDENGYVNADVLQRKLDAAELARKKAEEAERRAMEAESRISRFEQDAETKRLYESYPELDPLSDSFNQEAYNLVRNELTSQIVNTGRRDAMKAAGDMSKYFRTSPPVNQRVIEQRKQVGTQVTTQKRPPSTDLEELKRRSRNDPNALLERLERSGY